jgi:hypothetical protein
LIRCPLMPDCHMSFLGSGWPISNSGMHLRPLEGKKKAAH